MRYLISAVCLFVLALPAHAQIMIQVKAGAGCNGSLVSACNGQTYRLVRAGCTGAVRSSCFGSVQAAQPAPKAESLPPPKEQPKAAPRATQEPETAILLLQPVGLFDKMKERRAQRHENKADRIRAREKGGAAVAVGVSVQAVPMMATRSAACANGACRSR
jgi:hypothetical protein